MFSWFEGGGIYDINDNNISDESGKIAFSITHKFILSHRLELLDAAGNLIATIKQHAPRSYKFDIFLGDLYLGSISKGIPRLEYSYNIKYRGWRLTGDPSTWNFDILSESNVKLARVFTDDAEFEITIDIFNDQESLCVLLLVLAIGAEKYSWRQL